MWLCAPKYLQKVIKFLNIEIEFKPRAIKIVMMISLIYLILPQIIYEVLAFRTALALIIIVVSAVILALSWKLIPISDNSIYIPIYVLIVSEIVIWLVFLASGVGGIIGAQTSDYKRSNAILSDLVNYSWPVMYNENYNLSVLNYYIAYFVPGAFIGKIFNYSFHVAEIITLIWSVLGMTLGVLMIFALTEISKLKTIWILFCWGGLDCIGYAIVNGSLFYGTRHLEHWASIAKDYANGHIANYMSVASELNWGPQHFIPALLLVGFVMLMIKHKIYKLSILITSSLLFWSPLVAIGVLPFAIVLFVYEKGKLHKFISIPDIMGIIFIAIPMILYYLSMNLSSAGGRDSIIRGPRWLLNNWTIVLLFVILEYGIVGAVLFLALRNRSKLGSIMCMTSIVFMTMCLFIDYGVCHDFSMRATLIPWLIMFTYAPGVLDSAEIKYKKYLIYYMIGATITCTTEYARMTEGVIANGFNALRAENQNNTVKDLGMKYQYVGSPNSLFFDKLCRNSYDEDAYKNKLLSQGEDFLLYQDDEWKIYFYEGEFYILEKSGYESASVTVIKLYEDNTSTTKGHLLNNTFKFGTLSEIAGLGKITVDSYDWTDISLYLSNENGTICIEWPLDKIIEVLETSYESSSTIYAANYSDVNWENGISVSNHKKILFDYTTYNYIKLKDATKLQCDDITYSIVDFDYDSTWIHVYVDVDATACAYPNVIIVK